MAIVRRGRSIQSEKFAKKRRKKTIFVVVLFLLAIGSVLTTVRFFFEESFVQIKSIDVSGPVGENGGMLSIVPDDAVHADMLNALSGNWLYLFSKNTLFFYPKGSIRNEILKKYPAAASVDFVSSGSIFGFGNDITLHALITERQPFALACDATSNQSCFYLDSSGFVYAPAPNFSAGTYIQYGLLPSAASSTKLMPGEPLVTDDAFSEAKSIVSAVSGLGLNVIGDNIGADAYGPTNTVIAGSAGIATASTTATTTILYFNRSEPLGTELRYFSEFWKSEATSSAVQFQYIDLRYGKDIVYKLYGQSSSSNQ